MILQLRLFLFGLLLFSSVAAQGQRFALKKANAEFKAKNYGTALAPFEFVYRSDSSNFNIASKLAFCFLKTNQPAKALPLYIALTEREKVRPSEFFNLAETYFGLGRYEEATVWATRFSELDPEDPRSAMLLAACLAAPKIEPLFRLAEIRPAPFNSLADDNSPAIWGNKVVFSSDRRTGFNPLKQKSGATGRGFINLHFSEFDSDSFGGVHLIDRLNALNSNTSNASFSEVTQTVIFCQNSATASQQESFNLQLFTAEINGVGSFRNIEPLPFCSFEHNYFHPCLSADGSELFFVTDKSTGVGGTDIMYCTKTDKGWSKPESVSDLINTAANEGYPFFAEDGRLFFCSKGHPGLGGYDIFVSERDEDGFFKAPVNVGAPINSFSDDISLILRADGRWGFFTSSRGAANDDIYILDLSPQPNLEVSETLEVLSPRGGE